MTAWSYSSIKTFEQCPKKYYHLKVAKDFKDEAGTAAQYGTDVHKAAEDYIKDGVPIPPKFKYMEPVVTHLTALPGVKYTELKLGIKKTGDTYEPCDFFDKNVWWRGIADFVAVDGWRVYSLDYKTGKTAKYADTKQLDLIAGALFIHFPDAMRIKSSLAYVVSDEWVPKVHVRTEKNEYLSVFDTQLNQLEEAEASGVWNAKSGPLCGWCPVKSCEHWKPPRR
jgi:RecB family exonuclease